MHAGRRRVDHDRNKIKDRRNMTVSCRPCGKNLMSPLSMKPSKAASWTSHWPDG